MDGTGLLFQPLLRLWRGDPLPVVISYPSNELLSYDALLPFITSRLPSRDPYLLIAESFSGPIAARISARHPANLRGLVLSASFIRKPRGRFGIWAESLIGPYLFGNAIKHITARALLRWQGLSDKQVDLILSALDHVSPAVLAFRLKEALRVEAFEDLQHCKVPVLCLYAEKDVLLAKRCEELIRLANPAARMVGLDTSHFLLQTKPEEAFRAIQTFAKELSVPMHA